MINVTRSSLPPFEEYCEEIKDMWETHWLTNMGEKHNKLEENLREYLGVSNITLFTNGHLALESVLQAMHFPAGSEVITTPFTFASTTHAIVRNGLTPVFCDIKESDCTIDETKIEDLITDRTVAILPVHVYGNMCNVEAIAGVAAKHGLKVIYDAAHAFGVTYKGKSAASYGDAAMFSFHATKVFNTIEGGAVCLRDDSLRQVLCDLKNFGIRNPDEVAYVGGNAKMNEFQAAMGICNLRHLGEEIAKRRMADETYRRLLNGVPGIRLIQKDPDTESNYAYFPVFFEGDGTRDEVHARLKAEGIVARKYFYPITSSFDCYKGRPGADPEKTPAALSASLHVLTLPLYADLAPETVEKICRIVLP